MKKKKDGLIKGMIAAAIIFVVGFILTVASVLISARTR